jgi:hypothetical protein
MGDAGCRVFGGRIVDAAGGSVDMDSRREPSSLGGCIKTEGRCQEAAKPLVDDDGLW